METIISSVIAAVTLLVCIINNSQQAARTRNLLDYKLERLRLQIWRSMSMNELKNNTKNWVKAAGIRAIKTVAQTAIATIGTAAVVSSVDWGMVLSASVLAGFLSILTSIAGLPEVKKG